MLGRRAGLAGLTAAALALFGAADSEMPEVPPVPLYTPFPVTPDEAAGGVAPEISLKLHVDARGRVTAVENLGIRPASALDELFLAATREALLAWRYAPATREGKAVETSLLWTIKFGARPAEPEAGRPVDASAGPRSWKALAEREASDREYRRKILSLPRLQRQKFLTEISETAIKHFAASHAKATTPRVMAYTDAPAPELAQSLANNIEATFNVLQDLLGAGVVPQPEEYRVVAFMYANRSSFDALKGDVRADEWMAGFYNPAGLLAFHVQMETGQSLMHVLLHEATHAYLDRYVARPGVVLPRWLDEGLAEYVGSSEINKKGQLIAGKLRKRQVYRSTAGLWGRVSNEQYTLDEVKNAVRKKRALGVGQLVAADRNGFYGEQRRMYYPMAWLLVHFLRHGQESWAREKFPDLVLYVAEGYPPLEALRQVYAAPDALEAPFREYVLSF